MCHRFASITVTAVRLVSPRVASLRPQNLILPDPFNFRSNREIAFQQLQSGLAEKDFELAKLQLNQSNLVAEISELRRHTKREGVNLDYLKNIVLQVCHDCGLL